MKKSNFWIWFIPIILIVCVGIYFMINKVNEKNIINNTNIVDKKDAIKIKEEYENLNDKDNNIKVNLSENNSYIYATKDNLEKLFSGENGVLFVGNKNDNISRKTITILEEAISSTSIPNVYYVDSEGDLLSKVNEKVGANIKNGTIVTVKGGNVLESYFENLEHDELLKNYRKVIQSLIEACDENC